MKSGWMSSTAVGERGDSRFVRNAARGACVLGLLMLNVAIAASGTNAQQRDDSCLQYAGTGICWCDAGPMNECAFDSECITLHEACEMNPE